ncbi:MAG TPA: hypothetical protein ENH12_00435, partial [Proteobacteria bacterium]|nr:hypothetical protein [Pseudomonadota bacterium]
MRKMMVVLLAALMLFGVSFAVKAEVQNVRLGGDIRTRMYYAKNVNTVDLEEDRDDFFFRQRTRISAEADLTDNVWIVSTVEADGVWGQQVVNSDGEKVDNNWDVNIAEAYIQLSEILYSPMTIKVGRQYLNYGRGFLISSREWEYKFDAVRLPFDF